MVILRLQYHHYQRHLQVLNLDYSKSAMLFFGSSLQYCHKLADHKIKIFSIINLGIIYFPYAISKWYTFLKDNCLLFLFAALDFALSATRATVMVTLTSMYA